MFLVVGTTSFVLEKLLIEDLDFNLDKLLQKTYLFSFLFSLFVILLFNVIATNDKIFPYVGFIYLGLLVFKIMVFVGMLKSELFGEFPLPFMSRVYILIPIAISLFLEVFFIAKILSKEKD